MNHEQHRSPDGALTLVVDRDGEDTTIGFAGFEWHTHGDMLAASYTFAANSGLTPESAKQQFVADVLSNRAIIVIVKAGGTVRDVWVTDDVEKELRYRHREEEIEFRYWDGSDARHSG